MSLFSSARCRLNALGSTSRSMRAAQLPRPQPFILPSLAPRSISQQPPSSSSDDPTPETSSPVVPSPPPSEPPSSMTSQPTPHLKNPIFGFKFSSITTSDTLARVLKVRRLVPPSELALLPELEQQQRQVVLNILTKASTMDPEQRKAYFKKVDEFHPSPDVLKRSRKERAKEQVESGLFEEGDALSTEEWEENRRVRREAKFENEGAPKGWDRERSMKKLIAKDETLRRKREERLVVRREMKDAEEEERGSK